MPNSNQVYYASKYNQVTIFTHLVHVTSSVTWLFYTAYAIFYRCPIVIESLYRAVFEIRTSKILGGTTLTFQGHVVSSLTSRDVIVDVITRSDIGQFLLVGNWY